MKHPHADAMIAFANDTSLVVEFKERWPGASWQKTTKPCWNIDFEYRIKPKTVTKEEAAQAFATCMNCADLNSATLSLKILKTYFAQ